MRLLDCVGYLACTLVLLTFYMKDMVALRIAALCSNFAFLAYGIGLDLKPVILLHAALMPMNAWRLLHAWRARATVIQGAEPLTPAAARGVSSLAANHSSQQ